ncbi:MAG TPA: hypothetical protein VLA21_00465 [Candidatus Limnocylindria bacterium]|nr:hypothetical protein [Candidatus Limnocylindria bacterium]
MRIIRTKAVELTSIPAIAYKQKLSQGGAGIKIHRLDRDETAVSTLDKRTGGLVPYGKADPDLFPMEAFDEAYELTMGMPYSGRGPLKLSYDEAPHEEDVTEEAPAEQVDMSLSPEYAALVERYSDEKGRMNYALMNKDFIQFAAKSKTVADMAGRGALQEEILNFVVKSRAALAANRKESLDDASTELLIETLDEIDPRGAFKELKSYINRMLAKAQRG